MIHQPIEFFGWFEASFKDHELKHWQKQLVKQILSRRNNGSLRFLLRAIIVFLDSRAEEI